jgi:hypothetical protein
MRLPDGIGRNEILIGVAILVVLGIITIPFVGYIQRKSHRSEVEQMVKAIKAHLEAEAPVSDGITPTGWEPRHIVELDSAAVPWSGESGWDALGWSPKSEGIDRVRGTYRVIVEQDGSWIVEGWCDVDEDNEIAKWRAYSNPPEGEEALQQITKDSVY